MEKIKKIYLLCTFLLSGCMLYAPQDRMNFSTSYDKYSNVTTENAGSMSLPLDAFNYVELNLRRHEQKDVVLCLTSKSLHLGRHLLLRTDDNDIIRLDLDSMLFGMKTTMTSGLYTKAALLTLNYRHPQKLLSDTGKDAYQQLMNTKTLALEFEASFIVPYYGTNNKREFKAQLNAEQLKHFQTALSRFCQ